MKRLRAGAREAAMVWKEYFESADKAGVSDWAVTLWFPVLLAVAVAAFFVAIAHGGDRS